MGEEGGDGGGEGGEGGGGAGPSKEGVATIGERRRKVAEKTLLSHFFQTHFCSTCHSDSISILNCFHTSFEL